MTAKLKFFGGLIAVVAIAITCSFGYIFEDVKNENIMVCQKPFTGTMEVWNSPGVKFQGFGKVTNYYKTNQVWFNNAVQDNNSKQVNLGSTSPALPITFNDKGKGFILGSVRVQLPMNESQMLLIQTHYGSMDRLLTDLVNPTVAKAIMASGPLMSSLESVSEKRTDLYNYITDQLDYGIYKTEVVEVEILNTVLNEKQMVKVAQPIADANAPGGYQRQESSPFLNYGIRTGQLAIADIFYEKATLDQVSTQRDAEMSIISAKAQAAKAKEDAIRIEEEGRAEATRTKWEQEKINAVDIAQAEKAKETSRLEAEKAEYDKKAIIAKGQAEAEAARLKVAAGLSPLEKATIEKETAIGVAEALANSKHPLVPSFMVVNGEQKGGTNALDAVGVNMLYDLAKKMNK